MPHTKRTIAVYFFALIKMANKTSPHILGTATNLLGFCLIVVTSLHVGQKADGSLIDEAVFSIALALVVSCILSFVSIRTEDEQRERRLENIADILFLVALVSILLTTAYLTYQLWSK